MTEVNGLKELKKTRNVFGKIWIGPGKEVEAVCATLKEHGNWNGLTAAEIGILNVADDYQEYDHPAAVLYIHAGLNDGPPDWNLPYGAPNSIRAYIHAYKSLDFLVRMEKAVFLHCHGGVSRSAFVFMLFMWKRYIGNRAKFEPVKEMVKEMYSRANPHPKHELEIEKIKAELF